MPSDRGDQAVENRSGFFSDRSDRSELTKSRDLEKR